MVGPQFWLLPVLPPFTYPTSHFNSCDAERCLASRDDSASILISASICEFAVSLVSRNGGSRPSRAILDVEAQTVECITGHRTKDVCCVKIQFVSSHISFHYTAALARRPSFLESRSLLHLINFE